MHIDPRRCTPCPVHAFARALEQPLRLDGGLATALEASGHDLNDPLWSARVLLEDPGAIEAAHRRFVEAGAQVLTTASYQASLPGLAARGLSPEQSLAVLRSATDLARTVADAAPHRVFVAASAGPYGAYLADGSEYRGYEGTDLATLTAFHQQRLPGFRGADVIAFETIPTALEATAIAAACAHTEQDAWVSFSCRDDAHAASGEPIEVCVREALRCPRVVAVGVNCCAPQDVLGLLRRIATVTDLPRVAYPNAGRRYQDGAWHGDPVSPERFAELTRAWIDAGTRLVGGCCQIGAAHLQACD